MQWIMNLWVRPFLLSAHWLDLVYIFLCINTNALIHIDLCSPQWDFIYWRWQQQPLPACKLQRQDHAFLLLADFSRQVLQFLVVIPSQPRGINLQVHVIYRLYNPSSGALHHLLLNSIRLLQKQCLILVKTSLSQGCQLIWEVSFLFSVSPNSFLVLIFYFFCMYVTPFMSFKGLLFTVFSLSFCILVMDSL